MELNKIIQPQKVLLISSITTKRELPNFFKLAGATGINKIIPKYFLNRIYPFTNWYFGTKSAKENEFLRQIIRDTSPDFLKWAINEILNWKNLERPENVFQIHGTDDRIFPARNINADYWIKGGGHLMVYHKADAVSTVLAEQIGA